MNVPFLHQNKKPVGLPFAKMQSVGNDFVVLDESVLPASETLPQLAVRLCDRRFGIGGDGLLIVGKSDAANLRMQMFNPDGTEDMCGNGLRCLIHLAKLRGKIGNGGSVETLDGIHQFWIFEDGRIKADMGFPRFGLAEIPIALSHYPDKVRGTLTYKDLPVTLPGETAVVDAVNTGTTHSVLWRKELPRDSEFFQLSPAIETAPEFPERTSVMWAVVESPQTVRLRIWERGAGETLGCGTGACAVAVLAKQSDKLSADAIYVESEGGTLLVEWMGGDSVIYLSGVAQLLYEGVWNPDAPL